MREKAEVLFCRLKGFSLYGYYHKHFWFGSSTRSILRLSPFCFLLDWLPWCFSTLGSLNLNPLVDHILPSSAQLSTITECRPWILTYFYILFVLRFVCHYFPGSNSASHWLPEIAEEFYCQAGNLVSHYNSNKAAFLGTVYNLHPLTPSMTKSAFAKPSRRTW